MTNSSWIDFATYYKVEQCVIYGFRFLKTKKQRTENKFWKEIIESMFDLRQKSV